MKMSCGGGAFFALLDRIVTLVYICVYERDFALQDR